MSPRFRHVFQFPWRSRATIARDVDAELDFHLEVRVDELVSAGAHRDEARRQAIIEFGDLEYTRRYCRDLDTRAERETRLADRLSAWRQDLRYAWRALRHGRSFAMVSLVTLALAIGANTAIFSVARGVLLDPLPYEDPGALVALYSTPVTDPASHWDFSAADLVDYRSRQHSMAGIGTYYAGRELLTWLPAHADAEIVDVLPASPNLLSLLGVHPVQGRTFAPSDSALGAPDVAILSYGFWQRALGGDTGAVGRTLTLSGKPYTVVGVMPRGFTVAGHEDLWVPLDLRDDLANAAVTRKQHVYRVVARLKPGIDVGTARADVAGIARQLQREYPAADADYLATAVPLHETVAARLQQPVLLLVGAALLILLIACANLANLTLARTGARRTEIAVRAALGAGPARIARQLLTESVLLALGGAALGAVLAVGATRALLALNPGVLPPLVTVGVDGRMLGFCVLLSVATGVLFGLVPALDARHVDLHASLKERARSGAGGHARSRTRHALVVAQVALAVVLLVGAGLLLRSFRQLTGMNPGFDSDHVLTAQLRVDGTRYDSAAAVNRYYHGILRDIAAAPGVVAAGATMALPTQGGSSASIVVEGSPGDARHPQSVDYTMVRGDYFRALRIPILTGRGFQATDVPGAPPVAMLNVTAARTFFPHGTAVGHRVRIGPNPSAPWTTIIGVVGDVRQNGLDWPDRPLYYDNARQQTWWRTFSLVVRMRGDAAAADPIVRRAVKAADPTHAARDYLPLDQVVGASLASRRFALGLVAAFAALALLLATVGIYSVLAYSVTSRTREFGVRLALGAPRHRVLTLVLREGLVWSLLGLTLGIGVAVAGARLLAGMLYGVGPTDAFTYVAVAAFLLGVATVASAVPAHRATMVDPLTSMRAE